MTDAGRPLARFSAVNLTAVRSGAARTTVRVARVLADAPVRRAGFVRAVANATWRPHTGLALPGWFPRTPAQDARAAPMAGEHHRGILAALGTETATSDTLPAEGAILEHRGGHA